MLFLVTNHMLGRTQTNSMKLRSCLKVKYQESEHVKSPDVVGKSLQKLCFS